MQKLRDNIWLTLIMVIVACVSSFYAGAYWQKHQTTSPTSSPTITAEQGVAILDVLAEPHYYMIAHPELQSSVTGNTTFNQSIVVLYDSVQDLISWQQNRILELEKGEIIRSHKKGG